MVARICIMAAFPNPPHLGVNLLQLGLNQMNQNLPTFPHFRQTVALNGVQLLKQFHCTVFECMYRGVCLSVGEFFAPQLIGKRANLEIEVFWNGERSN